MQNIQVSIWVPIIVAILGIAGVIAGQLITSARDRKKWKLDEAQEMQRNQRDRATSWRNDVKKDYVDFVLAVEKLILRFRETAGLELHGLHDGSQLSYLATQGDVHHLSLALQITGSKAVQELCHKFRHEVLVSAMRAIKEGNVAECDSQLVDFRRKLVDQMRVDLGSSDYGE